MKPGQKDEDSLPPYPVLDQILRACMEDIKSIAAMGYSRKRVATRKLTRNPQCRLFQGELTTLINSLAIRNASGREAYNPKRFKSVKFI
ncbi:hypothetical protein [Desulfoscipio geothermicus]|uniref:hypothetical protein n=1 Tax=Desulfoscipio geothermicus TaxID=39060 RepID=UPI003183521D